ncbi:WG repeat-containing protein [Paenibacillus sp. UNC451MF]|uniref:WG repeat-containing protein n=1 Tax=Paenibacillus sp. UNC451MF TaxID=1449063 RepID=UPI00048FEE56|nr:WG repeat-containing protein [Paenibacillus sp. UNC451MF]
MNDNEKQGMDVRAFLPPGAELVTVAHSNGAAAIAAADLDGDKVQEIAAVYRLGDEQHLLILKYLDNGWGTADVGRVPALPVGVMMAVPVIDNSRNSLIIGWRDEEAASYRLSVYDWTHNGLRDVVQGVIHFSYIEAADIPGRSGWDGTTEIALWIHDAAEAFRVDILKWDDGAFVTVIDEHPLYYQKMVRYYEGLTQQRPDVQLYWYYLADAQVKADMPDKAIHTLRYLNRPDIPYPLEQKVRTLLQEIELRQDPIRHFLRRIKLFPASIKTTNGTRWGYIDNKGNMKLQPQYDYAYDFQSNGLARVQARGRNGVINTSGNYVVKPIYDSIGEFNEGRAAVIDSQGFKLMDESGRIVTKRAYSYIASLSNGRAMFTNTTSSGSSQYGYLDKNGNEVIPAQYESAGDFSNNKAVVQIKENEYALIGLNGEILAKYPYAFVGALGDGLLPFQQVQNGKYGYIDERGTVVIEPTYTGAQPFEEGRAVVNAGENYTSQYGLIDKQGSIIVKPEYNQIQQLGEQRVALGRAIDASQPFIGSVYAIADLNGNIRTDFRYYEVGNFHKGLASVNDRKQTFFIDRSGNAAAGYPRVNGSGMLKLEDSIIQANVDRRLSYLDRSGRVIWHQNTTIPLRLTYKVKEEKYKPNKDYLVYYPQLEGMRDRASQQRVNERLKVLSQVKPIPSEEQLSYSYDGDFDITFFKKDLLVIEINGYNYPFGAAHGMPSRVYAHLNVTDGQFYELKDLFKPGSPYVKVLSDIVARQIKEDPQYSYVFPDTYKGIKPDQPFFVTEHALHLYFEPYEIAPYAAGFPTFTIPFAQIMNLIDVNGSFWNSFHP